MHKSANLLLIIHEMIPQIQPKLPFQLHEDFWQASLRGKPQLAQIFPESYIGMEWRGGITTIP